MGALRLDFLKLVIISYSGDTDFFFMCRQKKRKERKRGIGVIYEMRPAEFYTAYNGFTRVTGTLGRSRFPRLR